MSRGFRTDRRARRTARAASALQVSQSTGCGEQSPGMAGPSRAAQHPPCARLLFSPGPGLVLGLASRCKSGGDTPKLTPLVLASPFCSLNYGCGPIMNPFLAACLLPTSVTTPHSFFPRSLCPELQLLISCTESFWIKRLDEGEVGCWALGGKGYTIFLWA